MSTSLLSDIQSLVTVVDALGNDKLDEVYGSLATHISAQGAAKISEAVIELQAIGLDPTMFIAPSKSYIRRQREMSRMEPEAARQRQQLEHEHALHQIELAKQQLQLRQLEAETKLMEASADRINGVTDTVPANA